MGNKVNNFWIFFNRLQEVLSNGDPFVVQMGERALQALKDGDSGEMMRLLDLDILDF